MIVVFNDLNSWKEQTRDRVQGPHCAFGSPGSAVPPIPSRLPPSYRYFRYMNYSLLQGRARVPGGVNIPSPAIQTIETVAKNDQAEWKKHLQPTGKGEFFI